MTNSDHDTIPAIDLGAFINGNADERRAVAAHVDEICRSLGFLVIKNHGVPEGIREAAWSSAKSFFEKSADEKNTAQSNGTNCPRGYYPVEGETLAKTRGIAAPPDHKETFSSGPLNAPTGQQGNADFDFFYGSNIWPREPVDFQKNWMAYYKSMEQLGAQIMQLFAAALNVSDDFFIQYHTHHISALRAQNYPATLAPLLPGQERAGAHSDYGSLTILFADPSVGGLEVKSPSGKWIKAPKVADAFIINIGDLLARWTNDRWVSTLHRVVEPEVATGKAAPRRQSIAYFMNPNYDATINAIETCVSGGEQAIYPPVLAALMASL